MSYWIVVTAFADWSASTPGIAPTGIATSLGYRFGTDPPTGPESIQVSFQVDGTPVSASVPEPSSLASTATGLVVALACALHSGMDGPEDHDHENGPSPPARSARKHAGSSGTEAQLRHHQKIAPVPGANAAPRSRPTTSRIPACSAQFRTMNSRPALAQRVYRIARLGDAIRQQARGYVKFALATGNWPRSLVIRFKVKRGPRTSPNSSFAPKGPVSYSPACQRRFKTPTMCIPKQSPPKGPVSYSPACERRFKTPTMCIPKQSPQRGRYPTARRVNAGSKRRPCASQSRAPKGAGILQPGV